MDKRMQPLFALQSYTLFREWLAEAVSWVCHWLGVGNAWRHVRM